MSEQQRGGIVVGWLVRVVLWLLLLGLVGFEAGAVIVAKVSADTTADSSAIEAATEFGRSHDPAAARAEAEIKARQGGGKVVAFSVSPDGRFVTVTVEKIAKTWIIQRIGPLRNHRIARATHTIKVT